jgi:hypothetical protein
MDDFSFILIDISLDAIARDPLLYERFCNGDNILFQKSDFEDPQSSPVFAELRKIPPLANKIDDFASICQGPIEHVPTLEEFLAQHRKGGSTAAARARRRAPQRQKPAGVSNVDFIRSTLRKNASGAPPSPSRAAAQSSVAARSKMPQTNSKANRSSTLSYTQDINWSWWVTVTVFALILGFVIKSL